MFLPVDQYTVVHLVDFKKGVKSMGTITKIISGTGILIAVYLILTNASGTTKIVNSLGSVYTSSVKTLQGR